MPPKSKLDYIAKYLGGGKGATHNQQPVNSKALKIIDDELEPVGKAESDDEDKPILVETGESLKLLEEEKRRLIKKKEVGRWVNISGGDNGNKSDSSDEEPRSLLKKRRRHDSDSEEEEGRANEQDTRIRDEIRRAMGMNSDAAEFPLPTAKTASTIRGGAEQFRNAETVYRDASGRRIDIREDIESKKKQLVDKNMEQIKRWGVGLKQREEQQQRRQDIEDIRKEAQGSKSPIKEHEKDLIARDRFGDPMKIQMQREEEAAKRRLNLAGLPKCKFPGTPNRYGVNPGHRWDGVDRGNGYERRLLDARNQVTAKQQMAYDITSREL